MTGGQQQHGPLLAFIGGIGLTLLALDLVQRNAGLTSPLDLTLPSWKIGFPCHDWLPPKTSDGNGWDAGVKLVPRAAKCKVRGFAIEELDPALFFRRSYGLGFTNSAESRDHLLSYFRAAQDDTLNAPKRRVYLDLGGQFFDSSLVWFVRYYPVDFTEYYVFEPDRPLFQIPGKHDPAEEAFLNDPNIDRVRPELNPVPITNDILDRIKLYNVYASNHDEPGIWNITRFIKDELKLKAEDTLIVKMDIEGAEYDILRDWLKDPSMADIVDELFVEIHYNHPSMIIHNWDKFAPHTLEEATQLFVDLRKAGFFVHTWP